MTSEINEITANKVLDAVRQGLVAGLGVQKPGKMCVEAAVSFALGLPHGDAPKCVSPALRKFKIGLNDAAWSSPAARAKGLERLALAQLGSNAGFDDIEFVRRLANAVDAWAAEAAAEWAAAEWAAEKWAAAKTAKAAARAAARAAAEWAAEAAKWAAARAAAEWAAEAAKTAKAAEAEAKAAEAAAAEAAAAKWAAEKWAAAEAAKWAAAEAAKWAAEKSADGAFDLALAKCAEDVVQILIDMKAPGCRWLYLTEEQ